MPHTKLTNGRCAKSRACENHVIKTSGRAASIFRTPVNTFRSIPEFDLTHRNRPNLPKFIASQNSYITYTALVEMFPDHLVDCAQSELFYELYMHAQISIPNTVTPRAILAGGCGNIWILAAAQMKMFESVLCCTSQRYRPTRGTNCVHHLCSPWSIWGESRSG